MVSAAMSDNGRREVPPPILDADDDGPAAATLDGPMLDELMQYGEVRSIAQGDVLYRAGDDTPAFFVILDGEAEIIRQEPTGDEIVVARHGSPGNGPTSRLLSPGWDEC